MGRVWQRAYRRHHYQRWEERHWHSPGKIHLHQPQKRPLLSSLGFGAKRRWVERSRLSLCDWFFLREVLGWGVQSKTQKLIPRLQWQTQTSISQTRESRNKHLSDWWSFPDPMRKRLLQLYGTLGPKNLYFGLNDVALLLWASQFSGRCRHPCLHCIKGSLPLVALKLIANHTRTLTASLLFTFFLAPDQCLRGNMLYSLYNNCGHHYSVLTTCRLCDKSFCHIILFNTPNRKLCWLYLQNTFRTQAFLATSTLPPWSKAPTPLTWIAAACSQLVSLLLPLSVCGLFSTQQIEWCFWNISQLRWKTDKGSLSLSE